MCRPLMYTNDFINMFARVSWNLRIKVKTLPRLLFRRAEDYAVGTSHNISLCLILLEFKLINSNSHHINQMKK